MNSGDTKRFKDVLAFKGIPFAKPPIGKRRWTYAEPLDQHDKVTTSLASPMQFVCDDPSAFFYQPMDSTSEDCLYLNIWAPSVGVSHQHATAEAGVEADEGDLLPVMVWLYGGGLVSGSAHQAVYDGSELARKGVVVVAINYRVGVFGYFSHPALSQESPQQVSGNYGTSDQIQALKWIAQHIAQYGGDTNNVTLFGQSAGALSISHLMISPLATGLFHKAILQSAYLPALPYLKKPYLNMLAAEDYGEQFGADLGFECAGKATLKALRELPAEALLQAASVYEFDKAVVDGYTILDQIDCLFEQGKQQSIPVLAGINRCEGSYLPALGLVQTPVNQASYIEAVKSRYAELADEYLTVYPADDLDRAAWAPIGNGLYDWGTEKLARLVSKSGSNTYFYLFDHPPLWAEQKGLGAFHTSELSYSFNQVERGLQYSESWPNTPVRHSDIEMAEIMSNYWVAFAYHGSPAVDGQPKWLVFNDIDRCYMTFKQGRAMPCVALGKELFALHEKMVTQRKRLGINWTFRNLGLLAPKQREADEVKKNDPS